MYTHVTMLAKQCMPATRRQTYRHATMVTSRTRPQQEARCRYTLGEVKEELLDAMGLNTEAEGSTMQFLRRGYKTTTWWEEDEEPEQSDAWRT